MLLLYATLVIYVTALVGVLWAAFARGDNDTRLAAWITIIGVAATQLAWAIGPRWTAFDPGIMLVDAGMVLGYGYVAHRSYRWWPIWMTAAQASAMLTHLAPLASPDAMLRLYQLSQPAWMFVVLWTIAHGSLRPPRLPSTLSPNMPGAAPPSRS